METYLLMDASKSFVTIEKLYLIQTNGTMLAFCFTNNSNLTILCNAQVTTQNQFCSLLSFNCLLIGFDAFEHGK